MNEPPTSRKKGRPRLYPPTLVCPHGQAHNENSPIRCASCYRTLEARVKELTEALIAESASKAKWFKRSDDAEARVKELEAQIATAIHFSERNRQLLAEKLGAEARAEKAEADLAADKWHGLANIRQELVEGLQARVKDLENVATKEARGREDALARVKELELAVRTVGQENATWQARVEELEAELFKERNKRDLYAEHAADPL